MKDTKERILLSALELFARYGYDATSVSRIAEAVGLTKGALYRHYEDKAAILRAILARMEADDAAFAGRFDLPTEAASACSPLICRQGYSHNADSALTKQCCLPAERPDTESVLTGRHASPTEAASACSPLVCRQGYSHNAGSAFTGQRCLPAERQDTESALTERHASPTEASSACLPLVCRQGYSHNAGSALTAQCRLPAERQDTESVLTGRHASPAEASSACSPLVCRQGYSHNADSAFTGQCCPPAERQDTESALTGHHASPAEVMGADSVLAGRRNPSVGASEGVSGESSQAGTAALLAFARAMFTYWTEDAFASAFRRMLTISQYTNPEMQALYRQYLSDGPLTYCEGILRDAGFADARLMALRLFAPMTFLYALYDGEADHTETLRLAEAHFDEMERDLR